MSKKNRNKSRPAQRPASPSTAPGPVARDAVAVAPAEDADPSPESALTSGPHAMADAADGAGTMQPAAIDAADDIDLPTDGAPTESGAVDTLDPADSAVAAETPAPRATESPMPATFTVPTPAPMASQGDIRGVLIQVAGARLLLPNATIAEVLSYADPEPAGADAPGWLLGFLRWRGWQVPLVAFGTLAGVAEERAVLGSKVVVLKALAGTSRTPYFAMLTQGFPRLVTVSRQALSVEDDDAGSMPRGVQARVLLNEDPALLPDLEVIEALVAEAITQAA